MKELLTFEFRKIIKQKSLYISIILLFAIFLITNITTKLFLEGLGGDYEGASRHLALCAVPDSMFSFLAAIFVAIVTCEDYDQQIVKNIYAKGYAREKVYLAKYVYVVACETIVFIATVFLSWLFGGIIFSFEGVSAKEFGLIACQYLAAMASVTLYFFVATLFKKVGSSVAINIFAPSVVSIFLGLIESVLYWVYEFKNLRITDFWLSSFLDSLESLDVTGGRIVECIIMSVVYIGAFLGLGMLVNRKHEV